LKTGRYTKLVHVAWAEIGSETSLKLAYVFKVLLPVLTDIAINVDIVYITNLRNTWQSHCLHHTALHI